MIYLEKPQNFNPIFEIVSCFVESQNKILLLHRQDHKPGGNTWGVPAGKVEIDENKDDTIIREINEETGIILNKQQLDYFNQVYVKYDTYDFKYHIYSTKLNTLPEILIRNDEHKDYKWQQPKQALNMNLIQDLDNCIKLFYKF